ncbi:sacsin N-terminal ATP-binding-like domain-containing protein [Actinopolyspora erythraea]|uniref:sacsin N-terminal ATP-binding-like domain-containing protein n=1 Tax=Actinopolyspora erythraea TaxID=414996 RepID=UPI000B1F87A8|nr:ATP-binding protein [Actinopolyspora erythraea]
MSDSADTGTAGGTSERSLTEGDRSGGDLPDPFDTAELRAAVLASWRGSPTRFREDANAEEDLRLGGYRDRLLVELAQNASDAARAAGVPGRLSVRLVDGELRVANTGRPLDATGVAGLTALRASPKRAEPSVGRFGVGFAAVLAVTDAPRLATAEGGVAFSAARTRDEVAALAESSAETPAAVRELAARGGEVPVLRLVWPTDERPPEGFDTEVRLPLREDVDPGAMLADMAEQVVDLLLALPALREVTIGDRHYSSAGSTDERTVVRTPEATRTWLTERATGEWPESTLTGVGVEQRAHARWWLCWAVELDGDGAVLPPRTDVLHAPTPTEERLSLPARLLAGVPVEPDRRRVSASPATAVVFGQAAHTYPELLSRLDPLERTALVPEPGFPLSDTDERLREAVVQRLSETAWLRAADGSTVAPRRATVLDHFSPELVDLLGDVVPGLLRAELSEPAHASALRAVGVHRMGAAELVEVVSGLDRPAEWWHRLYDALLPVERTDRTAREELTALPVPLADGRTVTGVRDLLLPGDGAEDAVAALAELDVTGLRIAAAEAVHPLLERLGARWAGASDLLDAPALVEAVHNSVADARAGADPMRLAEPVLRLVGEAGTRDWLGALALPDSDGEVRRADELLLPEAALLDVLDPRAIGPEAPLQTVAGSVLERCSPERLRAVGVLDSFAVLVEEEPDTPHEGVADAEIWWREQERLRGEEWPPSRFVGVRDLDLVAEDAWPEALRLLTANPETARAMREPGGYTPWWTARFAVLEGRSPRQWRTPDAERLAGLYDPVPDVGVDRETLRLAGVRTELTVADTADAADLVARLADPERGVRAGLTMAAHRALAEAVACERIDPGEIDPPRAVRSVSSAVISADRAVVLDEPWLLGVFEPALVVAGGNSYEFDAEALAELLDLPLASEQGVVEILGQGVTQAWRDVARVPAACELLGVAVPYGEVELRDGLRVRTSEGEHRVHWWVDDGGAVYSERSPDGLARALAWAMDRWRERFTLAALLADPEATTLLR